MRSQFTQLADQFGVDLHTLQQCADYVISRAKAHPEAFSANPEAFVGMAMEHYHKVAVSYYQEALDNPDKMQELAIQVAEQLCDQPKP